MGDGYRFRCLLKQPEIDVQSTSNRKLPNFYEKVTDFLLESYRISKWWQNPMSVEVWRDCQNRTIQTCLTNRLFMQSDWLFMQKSVRMWYEPCQDIKWNIDRSHWLQAFPCIYGGQQFVCIRCKDVQHLWEWQQPHRFSLLINPVYTQKCIIFEIMFPFVAVKPNFCLYLQKLSCTRQTESKTLFALVCKVFA